MSTASDTPLLHLLSAIPDTKYWLNRDGIFLDMREGTGSLYGDPKAVAGRSITEVLPKHIGLPFLKLIPTVLDQQVPSRLEYPLEVDGQLGYYEARICPVNEEEVIVIVRNLGDLQGGDQAAQAKIKELETQLDELQQQGDVNAHLENFAHTVSHDLREPVRTMNSFAQLLKRRYEKQLDQDAKDYLAFIISAAVHMNNLISNLLDYTGLDNQPADQPDTAMEAVDLNALVEGIKGELADFIGEKKAKIEVPQPLPSVTGRYFQLHQLFHNLLSNAIKFTAADGPAPVVTVEVEEKGDHWQFAIRDNGIGVAEENFEKIFTLFRRLHSKRVYPGSGIGLSICTKVVEQHGGQLWVASDLGAGSTFYFTLPR